MPSSVRTSKISGMEDFNRFIQALKKDLGKKALTRGTLRATQKWRDKARELAPSSGIVHVIGRRGKRRVVSSGNLRKSILAKKLRGFDGAFGTEVRYGIVIKESAFYWRWVEFGSSTQSAQGFLRKTFAEEADGAFEIVADEARKFVVAYAKRK